MAGETNNTGEANIRGNVKQDEGGLRIDLSLFMFLAADGRPVFSFFRSAFHSSARGEKP